MAFLHIVVSPGTLRYCNFKIFEDGESVFLKKLINDELEAITWSDNLCFSDCNKRLPISRAPPCTTLKFVRHFSHVTSVRILLCFMNPLLSMACMLISTCTYVQAYFRKFNNHIKIKTNRYFEVWRTKPTGQQNMVMQLLYT